MARRPAYRDIVSFCFRSRPYKSRHSRYHNEAGEGTTSTIPPRTQIVDIELQKEINSQGVGFARRSTSVSSLHLSLLANLH